MNGIAQRTATVTTVSTERRDACRMVEIGHYMVDSGTHTLVSYNVRASYRNFEEHWGCDCPASVYYRPCWHVAAVLACEAERLAGELAEDLRDIAEYLRCGHDEPASLVGEAGYCPRCLLSIRKLESTILVLTGDGKYVEVHPRCLASDDEMVECMPGVTKVRDAQALWSWDDGEAC